MPLKALRMKVEYKYKDYLVLTSYWKTSGLLTLEH